MKKNIARMLLIASLCIVHLGSAFGQVPISSTFDLGVWADADQNDGHSMSATYITSQGAILNPFSRSLSVTDTDALGFYVTTRASASATWVNAGQGSVAWRDMGWIHHTERSSGAKLNEYVTNQPVWSYTFMATSNEFFVMDYDVRARGNPFGLLGALIEWSGPGGDSNLMDPYTPVVHGTFVRPIQAGQTYMVALTNWGNIFTAPLPRDDFGFMDADFNWNVSAVPEPATLTALGIPSVVLLIRKRRRFQAATA